MATEKEIRESINAIESVETLRQIFKDVADALRRKGATTSDQIHPEEYAGLIDGISVGEDISDGTAVASDIAQGKIAYSANGRLVGDVQTYESGREVELSKQSLIWESINREIIFKSIADIDMLLRSGSIPVIRCSGVDLGDASALDVMSGKTFTSKSGLKVQGAFTPSEGTDTSDATATERDIASGKVAYGKNGKIVGTVETPSTVAAQLVPQVSTNWLDFYYTMPSDQLLRTGIQINLYCKSDLLGNAERVNVANGVTFTSKNGLQLTGTMPNAGSISGVLGTTGGASWSASDPNRGSGTVSITGVNQTAGYTNGYSNGTLSITVPANRLLKSRTITPTTTRQVVANAEDIAYGTIEVAGDVNLIPSNIVSGKSIFGVNGTASSGITPDVTFNNGQTWTFSGFTASNVSGSGSNVIVTTNSDGISKNTFMKIGSMIQFTIPGSILGNATSSDVASGKTFTSSAGFKVTGTASLKTVEPYENYISTSDLMMAINFTLPNNVSQYKKIVVMYNSYSSRQSDGIFMCIVVIDGTVVYCSSAYSDPPNTAWGFIRNDIDAYTSINGQTLTLATKYAYVKFGIGIYRIIAS